MTIRRVVLSGTAVAVLAATAWGTFTLTAGASSPASGNETFYLAFLKAGSFSGPIVADGAFTDAGTDKQVNANVDKEVFPKGSFEIDHHLLSFTPSVNSTTCGVFGHANGPITMLKGTGIYKNIKGTLGGTINVYYVTKRISTGCDDTTSQGGFTTITATGPVSF
jgi:hypothetical protein